LPKSRKNCWQSPVNDLPRRSSAASRIDTLRTNPTRCPVDTDSAAYGEEVRMLLYGKRHGKYRILFAIRADIVHVLTVRHSARQSLSEELGLDDASEGDDTVH
jgi:hypothetical protein